MTGDDEEVLSLGPNHRLIHAPDMDGIKYQSASGGGWYTQANLSYGEAMGVAAFMGRLRERHDIPEWKLSTEWREGARGDLVTDEGDDGEERVLGAFDPETRTIYLASDEFEGEGEPPDEEGDAG